MLEKRLQKLEVDNAILSKEVVLYQEKVKFLTGIFHGITTLTVALEKSTDAVAHIITDLYKRR